ncbi:MAG: NUDIX hydrolase [Kiritimatiellaeota bacterium]|nr:NUDIX hydrolase [Kiritimatiellota bacterium]
MHEKTLSRQIVYDGRILRLEVQEVELADGTRAVRELIRHAPAAAVLARGPDGRFLFVRQYRKAVDQAVLEIVAGICEPGEAPAATAARELREETGYTATRLVELGAAFATPGYVDERITLFYAEAAGPAGPTDRDADERLEVVPLTAGEFERRLRSGEIQDAKTMAAWLLYEKKVHGH